MSHQSLQVGNILRTAWSNVSGTKGKFWIIALISTIALYASLTVANVIVGLPPLGADAKALASGQYAMSQVMSANGIFLILFLIIGTPLIASKFMLSVERARGKKPNYDIVFKYTNRTLKLSTTVILILLLMIPFAIIASLAIGGIMAISHNATPNPAVIILAVALIYAFMLPPLIRLAMSLIVAADTQQSPWQSIKTAWEMTRGNTGKLVLCVLASTVVILLSLVPIIALGLAVAHHSPIVILLLIPAYLIVVTWAMPWGSLVWGELYHRLRDRNSLATAS